MDASPIAAEVAALQSSKGCAPSRWPQPSAEVGDFSRFRSGRQVTAYFGPRPEAEVERGLRAPRQGSAGPATPLVRRLAVEGSWSYVQASHQPKLMPKGSGVSRSR